MRCGFGFTLEDRAEKELNLACAKSAGTLITERFTTFIASGRVANFTHPTQIDVSCVPQFVCPWPLWHFGMSWGHSDHSNQRVTTVLYVFVFFFSVDDMIRIRLQARYVVMPPRAPQTGAAQRAQSCEEQKKTIVTRLASYL